MNDMTLKLAATDVTPPADRGRRTVAYVDGAIGGHDRVSSLAALFPQVEFVGIGAEWPDKAVAGLSVLIIAADASTIEPLIKRIAARRGATPLVVALRGADVGMARRLIQAGAADVLPAPVSEAALALSLQRILAGVELPAAPKSTGRVIGLLKAGGGVGATALGTQLAAMLAPRLPGGVCFVDLDIQFGIGGLFLDMAEAMTLSDILDGGGPLAETHLSPALGHHRSGARLLAAPRDLAPLEMLSPQQIEGLFAALRRDFALTIVDLPTVWTAWTNRALQLCDQIVLITHLTVPHTTLVKKQLRIMSSQRLDTIPLTLVCNAVSADQRAIVSQSAAEKAIGRPFDVVIPDDRRLMDDAVSQGCEISSLRSGSKLEKAIETLAAVIAPAAVAAVEVKRRWPWS